MPGVNLHQWAIKWGVPIEAVNDLRAQMGAINTDPATMPDNGSEAAAQTDVRLEASRKGARLWRNNVGATMDADGRFIRFGLCNDSKEMNRQIKSSDLVGIRRVRVEPYHVGGFIGQFVAREIKAPGWKFSGTDREVAQLRFLELVVSLGGDAAFATGEGTL